LLSNEKFATPAILLLKEEESVNQRARWVCVVAFLTCVFTTNSWAQEANKPEAQKALRTLQRLNKTPIETVFRGNHLTWVSGVLSAKNNNRLTDNALRFIRENHSLLRLSTAVDLAEVSRQVYDGVTYIRMEPRYQGWPVLGTQVVASLRQGRVRHITNGVPLDNLPQQSPAIVSARRAQQAVERWSGRPAALPRQPAWVPWSGGTGELLPVWVVRQREINPPHDWRYVVEATTGTVLWRSDRFLRAQGYVYDTNPVVAGQEVAQVELPNLESTEVLEGIYAQSLQCIGSTGNCAYGGMMMMGDCRICGESAHTAVAQEDGNFFYEPDEPNVADPFAEVHAYFHADRVARYFEEQLGFKRSCGGSQRITVYVNHHTPGDPQSSANAFYGDSDGDFCGDITLGEGMGIDFAYDGDVIYHEFAHGVVEQTGGLGCAPLGICWDSLGLNWTPMGLNEGFADYFALTLAGDPNLGEHVAVALHGGAGALRHGDNDHQCPFDLAGESHYDGQIWAGFGWDIRELLGAEISDRLMMRTLMAMSPDSGYREAAAAFELVAQEALADGEITTADMEEIERLMGPEGRGIKDCERIVPLDAVPEGHHQEPLMLFTFGGMTLPAGLQWSLATPRRAEELRFGVRDLHASAQRVTVHVRQDLPVDVKMRLAGMQVDLAFVADFNVDITDQDLVLNHESDPPLVAEGAYYFALEYSCPRGCLIQAQGGVEASENQAPVALAQAPAEVSIDEEVRLDGSASHDADGQIVTYEWLQTAGPERALATPTEAITTLTPGEEGTYGFTLKVTDDEGATAEDTLSFVVTAPAKGEAPASGDLDKVAPFVARGSGCSCQVARASTGERSSWLALLRSLLP
jgi:Zn-dependent metalloprotease